MDDLHAASTLLSKLLFGRQFTELLVNTEQKLVITGVEATCGKS
jgi:hypothetical protein